MTLYKYYPCDHYTFTSLENRGLWCHAPSGMNDPFECLAQVERKFSPEEINDFRKYTDNVKNETLDNLRKCDDAHFTDRINKLRKILIDKWAFCAMAKSFDDILMWSYYANGHRGIVIGFDFKKQNDRKVFQRVNYKSSLSNFDLRIYADFFQGKYLLPRLLKDISIKSDCWKREKEWRIWRSEPGYFHYTATEVASVHFGVNCDTQTELRVRDLLKYVTHGDFLSFKMEFKDSPIRLFRKVH